MSFLGLFLLNLALSVKSYNVSDEAVSLRFLHAGHGRSYPSFMLALVKILA